jgi:hypothetical protein
MIWKGFEVKTHALHTCDKDPRPLRAFVVILGETRMIQHAHNVLEIIMNINKTTHNDLPLMVRPATPGEVAQPELV